MFGISFKMKGPKGDLKTTINPIRTLTPRFIQKILIEINPLINFNYVVFSRESFKVFFQNLLIVIFFSSSINLSFNLKLYSE